MRLILPQRLLAQLSFIVFLLSLFRMNLWAYFKELRPDLIRETSHSIVVGEHKQMVLADMVLWIELLPP